MHRLARQLVVRVPRARPSPLGVCVGVVVLGIAVAPPAATGSFPGENGPLTFDVRRSTAGGMEEFCATPNCEDTRIYRLASGSRKPSQVVTCRARECHDAYPAWSPTARRLAFQRTVFFGGQAQPSRRTSVVVRRPGKAVQVVARDAYQPAWSPEGRQLVFGLRGDLFSAASDGSARRRLTYRGEAEDPDWSSRGQIAFTRRYRSRVDVFTVRAGDKARRLTRTGDSAAPSWSPHGRQIAFRRSFRRPGLYVMNARGEHVRRLLRGQLESAPAWSPDGRQIAFVRGRSIFKIRRDGSRLRRVFTLRIAAGIEHLTWTARR